MALFLREILGSTSPVLVATSTIALLYLMSRLYIFIVTPDPLDDFEWIGLKQEYFAKWRASLRSLTNMRETMLEGYEKFNKAEIAYVHPNLASGAHINLPPSIINEIIAVPKSVLDAKEPLEHNLQVPYTFGNPRVTNTPWSSFLSRKLTRALPELIKDTSDEIAAACDEEWGCDTEHWREVSVPDTCTQIMARSSNRVFVGKPLCRNKEFLKSACEYPGAIVIGGWIIRMFPAWMRWPISKLALIPLRKHLRICVNHIKPLIIQRKLDLQKKASDSSFKWVEPQDCIQWFLDEAERENKPTDAEDDLIAQKIMFLNLASIHTSFITATNAILDIFSATDSEDVVNGLREEHNRLLTESSGVWTKDGLNRMRRTDSAIRESLRVNPMNIRGLERLVKPKEGYTFKNGIHVPRGSLISVPVWAIQHDEDNYPHAGEFDAFRFSRPREEEASEESRSDPPQNATVVSLDNKFLPFGLGGHACPGRYFAVDEIKLLLAYLIGNYDVEPLTKRPENMAINENWIPNGKITMRIRRKGKEA